MKFYQEITLIPDDDIAPYFLWSKVYTQIHIALVDNKNPQIGVGFPQYRFDKKGATLGLKLRVFAQTEQELSDLNLAKWLERLSDYLHLKSVQAVPKNHRHAIFKRYHASPSKEAIARRYVRRNPEVDYQVALERLGDYQPELINYPFIELVSETSKKEGNKNSNFKLHIAKQSVEQAVIGEFNSYGLGGASVPDF